MHSALSNPESVLSCRNGECWTTIGGYSYKLHESAVAPFGLDVIIDERPTFDESKMSLWVPYADGNRRDGVGDLLEMGGIDTSRHKTNPLGLYDHGKQVTLPVASCEDPESHQYFNNIDPVTKNARCQFFFYRGKGLQGVAKDREYDHAVFCEQLYDLAIKRFVRGGSIGYQVIQARHLDPDYERGTPQGLHLIKTLMLEASLVVMPANQDTVRKSLEHPARQILAMPRICGKPVSHYLVKSLKPLAEKKAVLGYEKREPKHSDCGCGCGGTCGCAEKKLPTTKLPYPPVRVGDKLSRTDMPPPAQTQRYLNSGKTGGQAIKALTPEDVRNRAKQKNEQSSYTPPDPSPNPEDDFPLAPGMTEERANRKREYVGEENQREVAGKQLVALCEQVFGKIKGQATESREPGLAALAARLEMLLFSLSREAKGGNLRAAAGRGKEFYQLVSSSRLGEAFREAGGDNYAKLLELKRAVRSAEIESGIPQLSLYNRPDFSYTKRYPTDKPPSGAGEGASTPSPKKPSEKPVEETKPTKPMPKVPEGQRPSSQAVNRLREKPKPPTPPPPIEPATPTDGVGDEYEGYLEEPNWRGTEHPEQKPTAKPPQQTAEEYLKVSGMSIDEAIAHLSKWPHADAETKQLLAQLQQMKQSGEWNEPLDQIAEDISNLDMESAAEALLEEHGGDIDAAIKDQLDYINSGAEDREAAEQVLKYLEQKKSEQAGSPEEEDRTKHTSIMAEDQLRMFDGDAKLALQDYQQRMQDLIDMGIVDPNDPDYLAVLNYLKRKLPPMGGQKALIAGDLNWLHEEEEEAEHQKKSLPEGEEVTPARRGRKPKSTEGLTPEQLKKQAYNAARYKGQKKAVSEQTTAKAAGEAKPVSEETREKGDKLDEAIKKHRTARAKDEYEKQSEFEQKLREAVRKYANLEKQRKPVTPPKVKISQLAVPSRAPGREIETGIEFSPQEAQEAEARLRLQEVHGQEPGLSPEQIEVDWPKDIAAVKWDWGSDRTPPRWKGDLGKPLPFLDQKLWVRYADGREVQVTNQQLYDQYGLPGLQALLKVAHSFRTSIQEEAHDYDPSKKWRTPFDVARTGSEEMQLERAKPLRESITGRRKKRDKEGQLTSRFERDIPEGTLPEPITEPEEPQSYFEEGEEPWALGGKSLKGYKPGWHDDSNYRSLKEADSAEGTLRKHIRHEDGKWILYTRDGSRKLGTHGSKEEALAQERAIEASKHKSLGYLAKRTKRPLCAIKTKSLRLKYGGKALSENSDEKGIGRSVAGYLAGVGLGIAGLGAAHAVHGPLPRPLAKVPHAAGVAGAAIAGATGKKKPKEQQAKPKPVAGASPPPKPKSPATTGEKELTAEEKAFWDSRLGRAVAGGLMGSAIGAGYAGATQPEGTGGGHAYTAATVAGSAVGAATAQRGRQNTQAQKPKPKPVAGASPPPKADSQQHVGTVKQPKPIMPARAGNTQPKIQ